MKIKLVASGFEGFTGVMGTTEFENGVSVAHVSRPEARLLAAILSVVDAKSGKQIGDLQDFDDVYSIAAVTTRLPTLAEIHAMQREDLAPGTVDVEPPMASAQRKIFTIEELAAVADSKGIGGLREIAEPLGVRAASIANLITAILEAQSKQTQSAILLADGSSDASGETVKDSEQPPETPDGASADQPTDGQMQDAPKTPTEQAAEQPEGEGV